MIRDNLRGKYVFDIWKSINVVIHHINGMKDKEQTEHSRGQLETGTWMTTLHWFGPDLKSWKRMTLPESNECCKGKKIKKKKSWKTRLPGQHTGAETKGGTVSKCCQRLDGKGPVGLVVGGHAYLTIKSSGQVRKRNDEQQCKVPWLNI